MVFELAPDAVRDGLLAAFTGRTGKMCYNLGEAPFHTRRIKNTISVSAVGDGLFAAFSGKSGKVRFNLGEARFKHAPPASDFQAYAVKIT